MYADIPFDTELRLIFNFSWPICDWLFNNQSEIGIIYSFEKKMASGYDYIAEDFRETDYFIFEGYPEQILEPVDQPLLLKSG